MKKLVLLFPVLLLICTVQSAKILAVFPMPAPSHYILGSSLIKGLHKAGHEVTMISPFAEVTAKKQDSYRDIKLTGFVEKRDGNDEDRNMFKDGGVSPFILLPIYANFLVELSEETLIHPNVVKLLNSGEKFDVVIVEDFINPVQKLLANYFNASLVVFSTIGSNSWNNDIVGNPAPPSYVPDLFLSYSSDMSFFERIHNSLIFIYHRLLFKFYTLPKHKELAKKYFPNAPDLEEILYNPSLLLLNSHPSTNLPAPHVPNMIEIGGFHIQPSNKSLPAKLQNFLDDAPDGAIYFSMGSNLKSKDLPLEQRNAILKTFSKLKQKVLWKFETDDITLPPNVMIRPWFPQQDILAHKNVKLFITHGGLLSTTESIYYGVPALAIPVFGDQKLNAQNIVNGGFGLSLPYTDITEENLTKKIQELVNNPRYRENAVLRSKIFHDRMVDPMKTAVYWIEYVIRNKDTSHLRVAGVDLPWWKYLLLDVVAFVAVLFLIPVVIFCHVIKKCLRRKNKGALKSDKKIKKQ